MHREPGSRACAPRSWLLCAALGVLPACSLGPRYHRPEIPPPPAWVTTSDADASLWPTTDWWRGFGSDDLNALI